MLIFDSYVGYVFYFFAFTPALIMHKSRAAFYDVNNPPDLNSLRQTQQLFCFTTDQNLRK